MICNFCFANKYLKEYIEENGDKAETDYRCPECKEKNKI